MELYQEILTGLLAGKEIRITFPELKMDGNRLVETECYKTLQKIQAVLQDDSLEDAECFAKIEEIVCIFEALGSSGGNRHDFG